MTAAAQRGGLFGDRPYRSVDPGLLALAKTYTESRLQSDVLAIARGCLVWAYHTHDSRRSQAGWPDLVLIGPKGTLFRELKRQTQRPTPIQQAVLDGMAATGLDAALWQPVDLLTGRVRDEVAALGSWPVGATLRPGAAQAATRGRPGTQHRHRAAAAPRDGR